jgi:hypothetical protein
VKSNNVVFYRDYDSLKLDDDFFDSVQNGNKFATIRRGLRLAKPGTILILESRDKSRSIRVVLKSIEIKEFGSLTDEDARIDGFDTRYELQSALKKCYRNISESDAVTVLRFGVLI